MQLRTARLCLDCEEVHDANVCPSCASETFTYMTRWIPAPERRGRARPTTSPEAEMIRNLMVNEPAPSPPPPTSHRRLKQGMVGLTALGLAGWLFRKK